MSRTRATPSQSSRPSLSLALGLLLVITAIAVGAPALKMLVAAVRLNMKSPLAEGQEVTAPAPPAESFVSLIGTTAVWTLLIGALATALAYPAAWAIRRHPVGGRRWRILASLALVPLLLPSYLAYAGWGNLRAPSGPLGLGDWLGRQPPWVSMAAGRAMAIWGLALWAWPLASMLLAGAARRIPTNVLETIELDSPPGRLPLAAPFERALAVIAMMRGTLIAAVLLIALVMAGSSVPLHLAQINTYAIAIWRDLLLTTEPAGLWAKSWPLLLLAAAAAVFFIRRVAGPRSQSTSDDAPERSETSREIRTSRVLTALIWCASVLVPLALFVLSLREYPKPLALATMGRMIVAFWRLSAGAVATSLQTSLGVALGGLLIASCVWAALGIAAGRTSRARSALLALTAVLLTAGLTPGILIGSATQAAWNTFDWSRAAADTPLIVIAGHIARYGFLPALVGWWCAGLESHEERDLRRIDGGDTFRGWCQTRLLAGAGGIGAVIGSAIAVGVLSFHEIEAATTLQPPGAGTFAQQLLENLHFARDERVAAAAVSLLLAGILIAFVAAYLVLPVARSAGAARSADRPAS